MIVSPKKEWEVIESEENAHGKLFMKYVLPLSLIPAVAAFIGYGLIGYSRWVFHYRSIDFGIRQAATQWISLVVGIYLAAFIINLLAEQFKAKKDFNKAFALVAYSYIPMFLGGIFYILPSLSVLALIAGIYSLYLLYVGMRPMMQVPAEKNTTYFIVSLLTMIVVTAVLTAIMSTILLSRLPHHF